MAANTLRAAATTVASVANGNEITVADMTGFEVNDEVIVESLHEYNTDGIDGNWSWPFFDGGWATSYYFNPAIKKGKAWRGTISNISGSTIYLSRELSTEAVGLPFLRDNSQGVTAAIASGASFPEEETFYCGIQTGNFLQAVMPATTEMTIDFNGCTLEAPRGCPALDLRPSTSGDPLKYKRFKNLILQSNARDEGYGVTGLSARTFLFHLNSCQYCEVENFTFRDGWRSIGGSYSNDITVSNCRSSFVDPLRQYVQWEYQTDNCNRWVFDQCVIDSDWARAGFEPFRSKNITFSRCGGRNVGFACNSSGNILFKDIYNIWDNDSLPEAWSISNPIMNINRNQGGSDIPGGCFVDGFRHEYRALPQANRLQRLITVGGGTAEIKVNARIRNITYINPFPDSTDGNGNAQGYIVAGDVNAGETKFGGTNSIASLNNGNIYYKAGSAATPNEDLTPNENEAP